MRWNLLQWCLRRNARLGEADEGAHCRAACEQGVDEVGVNKARGAGEHSNHIGRWFELAVKDKL